MDYGQTIASCENGAHMINMVTPEQVVELGYRIGLGDGSSVLDLCCGYGTTLKLWSEVFGITGTGVDRCAPFIEKGKTRIDNGRVELICGDVLEYKDDKKYDVVVCTEFSAGLYDSFDAGIKHLEGFLKPGGTIVFGRLFAKELNPPRELIEFDGDLPTLGDIYGEVRRCGYMMTAMISGTDAAWERYIFGGAKGSAAKLRENPGESGSVDRWFNMYFDNRRKYEGWALFAAERVTND